ncbi:MAG: VPA1262 family protein [Alcaligenaceae bacterium]|nr:VPA1262 family protein [Alcaligenaceae bacterium]
MNPKLNLEGVSFKLTDLVEDSRLLRLFSDKKKECAIQLWLLRLSTVDGVELRLVYGRLVPYTYSNNRWSYSERINNDAWQITKLNLYIKSDVTASFLEKLCEGKPLSIINFELNLNFPTEFDEQFGSFSLNKNNLAYKPVSYLLNQTANEYDSISSPHSSAGALSASIIQLNKNELIIVDDCYDAELIELIVSKLNLDTGLDFRGTDKIRLGDFELLEFPTLTASEKELLDVEFQQAGGLVCVRLDSQQLPEPDGFQFRLSIQNQKQIIYSSIALANQISEYVFEYKFEVSDDVNLLSDSTEVEIYGYANTKPGVSSLCCRYRVYYIREVELSTSMLSSDNRTAHYNWLERNLKKIEKTRALVAQTRTQDNPKFKSLISIRKSEPWVSVNQELKPLLTLLSPSKSEGKFILSRNRDNNSGKLELTEWFKKLFSDFSTNEIIIFDPYFDSVGVELLSLHASIKAKYLVFTSVPESYTKCGAFAKGDSKDTVRINSLLNSIEENSRYFKYFKIKLFGLKAGEFHDRYILIMGEEGLAIKGYNLSNSLQNAAEDFPLLITPIPADVLLEVERYASRLIQNTYKKESAGLTTTQTLYDSSSIVKMKKVSQDDLKFLDSKRAGCILSLWTSESSLCGLSGQKLKDKMHSLSLMKDGDLKLGDRHDFIKSIANQRDYEAFVEDWHIISELLARSRAINKSYPELIGMTNFLDNLRIFLDSSIYIRSQEIQDKDKRIGTIDFKQPLMRFLNRFPSPHHMSREFSYEKLRVSDYYAIKLLWHYDPNALIALAEEEVAKLASNLSISDVYRLSVLSQMVCEIVPSVMVCMTNTQLKALLGCNVGVFRWMGFYAILERLLISCDLSIILEALDWIPQANKVLFLVWIIEHLLYKNEPVEQVRQKLVNLLLSILPSKLSSKELEQIIQLSRGRHSNLFSCFPWCFNDVLGSLIEDNRVDIDVLCRIWFFDLFSIIEVKDGEISRTFKESVQGQSIRISAYLFSGASKEQQLRIIKSLRKSLTQSKRTIQQPLASTSSYSKWDGALEVSMWILAITKCISYFLQPNNREESEIDELILEATKLISTDRLDEWRYCYNPSKRELAQFIGRLM